MALQAQKRASARSKGFLEEAPPELAQETQTGAGERRGLHTEGEEREDKPLPRPSCPLQAALDFSPRRSPW